MAGVRISICVYRHPQGQSCTCRLARQQQWRCQVVPISMQERTQHAMQARAVHAAMWPCPWGVCMAMCVHL